MNDAAFFGTIEFLSSRKAVVTLTDRAGNWAGSFRVDAASKADLYERGYGVATANAACKGGHLESFKRAA